FMTLALEVVSRKILLGMALLLAAASASAQTYTFSSCAKAVTLTVNVDSIVSTSGPFPDGSGGHQTTVIFFGDFTLTAEGSTQTYSSVVSGASFSFSPSTGNLSTFLIQIAPGGPIALQATLQGAGDLIPNGQLPAALPPLSQWTAPNLGMTHDYIQVGNPSVFYLMDSFGNCSSGPGTATPDMSLVISAGAFGGFHAIAPGTWIEIYGSDLAPVTRGWAASDFNGSNAPTSLNGVEVLINGEKAFVDYISPGQIDAEVPADIPSGGPVNIAVDNNGATSKPYSIMVNGVEPGLLAPAVFNLGGNQYAGALLAGTADATYILPTGEIAGVTSRPAKPGETIVLYGIGFGLVIPPPTAGVIAPGGTKVILPLNISIGGIPAQIGFEGLAPGNVGLYQFNVVVPTLPDSDLVPLTLTLAGNAGTQTLYIAVHQ
ncbi:MAG TPA: IPT/TIG domain-containing protein, partial [Bryobacteraceae bacterium]|nr:IPT/TIG domain-containing protein [Bryobacteraceae bacterium]